ncbi:hypothetical protein RND81_07G024100 [Saponaria officinalis]|uniref:Ty3-gypsy retrotransposon protein n=1 Tax=Saponaria officinalis TaxID=3572 RepID=A0AAW1JM49_SAPOF
MSTQKNSATTPAKSYAAILQSIPSAAASSSAQPAGIYTRRMTRKAAVDAAVVSLRTARVPTRPRKISAASIAAAATAIIRAASPSREEASTAKENEVATRKSREVSSRRVEAASPVVASVMTIGDRTIEDQIQDMKKLLEQVLKDNEEKNKKIEDLQKVVTELRDKDWSQHGDTETEEEEEEEDDEKKDDDKPPNNNAGIYTPKQLQDMIADAIKSQLGDSSSNSLRYIKPYTRRIDSLRMPTGYQPIKFQQFDGKDNPKQHIAHFVETCNNAGTDGDLLVNQFVRSLKGLVFD